MVRLAMLSQWRVCTSALILENPTASRKVTNGRSLHPVCLQDTVTMPCLRLRLSSTKFTVSVAWRSLQLTEGSGAGGPKGGDAQKTPAARA